MSEEEKKDAGSSKPSSSSGLEPGPQMVDVSTSGHHIILRPNGSDPQSPLEIYDIEKSDNMAIYVRTTSVWIAHLLVLGFFYASFYAQLVCVPPRQFNPPIELIGLILGIYWGTSANVITKLIQIWHKKNGPKL